MEWGLQRKDDAAPTGWRDVLTSNYEGLIVNSAFRRLTQTAAPDETG